MSSTRSTVLAVDAGNSKTDVAVVAGDGAVLGAARGPGFRPHVVGADGAMAVLAEIVEKAAVAAGRPDTSDLVDHVSACLANVDLPDEQRQLEHLVGARGWGRSSSVFNDTFALLRAGLDEPQGVAVICGAGINCTGRRADGEEVRFAAVGQISGDWGGGGFLWSEAMWWAARAADGRGDPTVLETALPALYGLASMAALIEAVHLGRLSPARCAEMTPLLFEVAAAGDAIATSVVRRQGAEVATLAAAALDRLGLLGQRVGVVLGGGVLTAGHQQLLDSVRDELGRRAPGASARVVPVPLVAGAALLGLDHLDVPEEAKQRLREGFASTPPHAPD